VPSAIPSGGHFKSSKLSPNGPGAGLLVRDNARQLLRVYCRDIELFVGSAASGLL